jgi:hypothetical protein
MKKIVFLCLLFTQIFYSQDKKIIEGKDKFQAYTELQLEIYQYFESRKINPIEIQKYLCNLERFSIAQNSSSIGMRT